MSAARFYLTALPGPYWASEQNDVRLAQFAQDALGCEKRLAKEVNLQNEYPRYTLLSQQIQREVLASPQLGGVKDASQFRVVLDAGRLPVQICQPGYLALLSRAGDAGRAWRLGAGSYPPDQVVAHAAAFGDWSAGLGLAETPLVRQRLAFFQWAAAAGCGVVEFQTAFHPPAARDAQAMEVYGAPAQDEEDHDGYVTIPDLALDQVDTENLGKSWSKAQEARMLSEQIMEAVRRGEAISFGSQAKHDVIAEVLHEFVFVPHGERPQPVEMRVAYADGSEGRPFPLRCLAQPDVAPGKEVEPLRVALMSMRHLEMDPDTDFCWFRNREVSRTRTLSETDEFCFDTTRNQIRDSLALGDLGIHLFHTGFEPAIIGFYRGLVSALLALRQQAHSPSLSVTPFYFRGPRNPYQQGSRWS